MLSRRLAKIDCNVPLAQKARELEELKPDRARLRELFIRMEFSQLMKRMHLSEEETEKGHDNTAMLTFEESILPADSLKSLPAGSSGTAYAACRGGLSLSFRRPQGLDLQDASV